MAELESPPHVTSFTVAGGHLPQLKPRDPFHTHPHWRSPSLTHVERHSLQPSFPTFPTHQPQNDEGGDSVEEFIFNYPRLLKSAVLGPRCPECSLSHNTIAAKLAVEGEVTRVAAWTSDAMMQGRLDEEALKRVVFFVLRRRVPPCLLHDYTYRVTEQLHFLSLALRTGCFVPVTQSKPVELQATPAPTTYPIQLGQPTEVQHEKEVTESIRTQEGNIRGQDEVGSFTSVPIQPVSASVIPLSEFQKLSVQHQKLSRLLVTILESDLLPDLRRLKRRLRERIQQQQQQQLEQPDPDKKMPSSQEMFDRRASIGSVATQATLGENDWRQTESRETDEDEFSDEEQEMPPVEERFENIVDEMQQTLHQIQLQATLAPKKQMQKKPSVKRKRKRSVTREPVAEDAGMAKPEFKRMSIDGSEHDLRDSFGTIPGYYKRLQQPKGVRDVQDARNLARRRSLREAEIKSSRRVQT